MLVQPVLDDDDESVFWEDLDSSEDSLAGEDLAGSTAMNETETQVSREGES